MTKDRLYRTPKQKVPPFEFNAAVAHVFDDMIHRSVPMYAEIIRRQAQMAQQQYRPGTRIYDLGCSNGNLTMALCQRMPAGSFAMVAVDSSRPMLAEFEKRLAASGRTGDVRPLWGDIREIQMDRASVVVVNFTLQFIPAKDRDALLQRIHDEQHLFSPDRQMPGALAETLRFRPNSLCEHLQDHIGGTAPDRLDRHPEPGGFSGPRRS